jgi:hypothetical protein
LSGDRFDWLRHSGRFADDVKQEDQAIHCPFMMSSSEG